jgi:hypothetical protein
MVGGGRWTWDGAMAVCETCWAICLARPEPRGHLEIPAAAERDAPGMALESGKGVEDGMRADGRQRRPPTSVVWKGSELLVP